MNKKLIIIALLVNTAISLLTLSGVGYLYVNSPKFVSFDIKSTTDTFLNQVAKLNLSEEEQTALMKKYERSINNIINEYDKDGKIVFVKGAVISQLSDETQEIKAKLAKKMRGGNDE
ncbi:TrbI F-type domain-containing protein [Proteus mirabilis]|uniref:TrbI F-type domain-containing protein n=1 Tax=Gammaproteobacteria TaxID=1236 RepID=UPI000E001640|nr:MULTISPECIES: TrbI F-type domain-containing protein [Gammaproteobacteria]ELA7740702.1 TrbI F-type domain-containing protein [Proteus mirabilis]MBG2905374.1 TrbI F-type domain-containing protein [Proteus mirabilis]MBG3156672.1 TrbI F-type domain-containing protein [Proteus mirabilis]MBG5994288.1 TrbI F-type domain-containing protein [Proteus mirabilis]MBI6207644.1 TrbI F-type domain-containing protein [Proteus mirabilis]